MLHIPLKIRARNPLNSRLNDTEIWQSFIRGERNGKWTFLQHFGRLMRKVHYKSSHQGDCVIQYIRRSGAGTKAMFFFSLIINVLSVRLKVNMNPDQFRLLSVCLCLSLSSGITIKSASHLLQGEPGGKMFCILSLMPQKLNALITSDLRWSALVTVPLHIFDLIHMYPMNTPGHQEGGQMILRLLCCFILARKCVKTRRMFPRGQSIQ